MSELTEQRLGYGFSVLGDVLIALGGPVSLVVAAADLLLGRPFGTLGAVSAAVVLFVLGGLAIFFAWLGRQEWSSRPLASGVLLVVLAALGWIVVGVGSDFLSLIGSLFVFIVGVLFLVEPAKSAANAVVSRS